MDLQVDNRYSEVGPPRCPETSVKHKKGLFWQTAELLAVAGLAIVLGASLLGAPDLPSDSTPDPVPTIDPTPEPTPPPDIDPEPVPEPEPEPEPEPNPDPDPTLGTTGYTVHYYLIGTMESVAEDLVVTDLTIGKDVTVSAASIAGYTAQEPTSVTITLAENPADNVIVFFYAGPPPPSPPKAPTVTINHIWYWPGLYHMVVEYTVTANDATNLSSTSTLFQVLPDLGGGSEEVTIIEFDAVSGAGTFDRNVSTIERVVVDDPADLSIRADVVLTYTLGGQTKTLTKTVTQTPELKQPITLGKPSVSQSGDASAQAISSSVQFKASTDDPHTFEPEIGFVEMVFLVPDSSDPSGYAEYYGNDFWGGWSGPSGPTTEGGESVWTWTFDTTISVNPADYYGVPAEATHYKLKYIFDGLAGYTENLVNGDRDTYEIREPSLIESDPLPIDTTPVGPTVNVTHFYYWPELCHLVVEYTVTANDAEDITSGVILWTDDHSWDVVRFYDKDDPTHPGALAGEGSFILNDRTDGEMVDPGPGFVGIVEVDLYYTLDGVEKSETVEQTKTVEIMRPFSYDLANVTGEMFEDGLKVTANPIMRVDSSDRHKVDPEIGDAYVCWYKLEGGTYTELPGATLLADGTIPFTASADGSEFTFQYADVIPIDEVNHYIDDYGATHYKVFFGIAGDATDSTDGTVYDIGRWGEVESAYLALPSGGSTDPEDPTVGISHLWHWGTLNAPGGLNQWEVQLNIDPGDATDISSAVTLTCAWDTSRSVSATVAGSGTLNVNMSGNGQVYYPSSGDFIVDVVTTYTLDGATKTTTAQFVGRPQQTWGQWTEASVSGYTFDGGTLHVTGTFGLGYTSGDRHTYSMTPSSLIIQWGTSDYEWNLDVLDSTTVWSGGGTSPFAGPTTSSEGVTYSFSVDLAVTPPAGATHFRIVFDGTASGADAYGTWTVNQYTGGNISDYTQSYALN